MLATSACDCHSPIELLTRDSYVNCKSVIEDSDPLSQKFAQQHDCKSGERMNLPTLLDAVKTLASEFVPQKSSVHACLQLLVRFQELCERAEAVATPGVPRSC